MDDKEVIVIKDGESVVNTFLNRAFLTNLLRLILKHLNSRIYTLKREVVRFNNFLYTSTYTLLDIYRYMP